jgi:hypothetical protein
MPIAIDNQNVTIAVERYRSRSPEQLLNVSRSLMRIVAVEHKIHILLIAVRQPSTAIEALHRYRKIVRTPESDSSLASSLSRFSPNGVQHSYKGRE